MKKFARWSVFGILIAAFCFVFFGYYSYIFSKNVEGQIVGLNEVPFEAAGSNLDLEATKSSFVIAIRTEEGKIYTSRSGDSQWGLAQEGQCATTKIFPHPPWNFKLSGTYYGAVMVQLRDCLESENFLHPRDLDRRRHKRENIKVIEVDKQNSDSEKLKTKSEPEKTDAVDEEKKEAKKEVTEEV